MTKIEFQTRKEQKRYLLIACLSFLSFTWLDRNHSAQSSESKSAFKCIVADDGTKDKSFRLFRSQLENAITRHDGQFIEKTLYPEVGTALGGEKGKQAFKRQWKISSARSPFWQRMNRVLIHGAKYDPQTGEFNAPAVSLPDNTSGKVIAAVWNEKTPLHKAASDSSPTLRLLDCQQVTLLSPKDPLPIKATWVEVKTTDGASGFIKSENIYSAYDEYAAFKKINGKWLITWFGFAGL